LPFSQYKDFNPKAMEAMTAAYDAVIAKLEIPKTDPRTSQIAAKIVSLASKGEHDPAVLCEKTCAQLSE
jgi:hypothetical protein